MSAYQVVFQHADFIVINKAAGVHFHSQDGSAGVVAQVEADLNLKLYPVHRLDTPTSGLIILATSATSANTFTNMFTAHSVQKYYLALAKGKPKKKQGWVIGDMAKSRRSMYKLMRTTDNPAITQFFSASVSQGLRAYLLKPHSGKTHQLRVALASIGVPILGDDLYGKHESERCYLHAFQLNFTYQGDDFAIQALPHQGAAFTSEEMQNLLTSEWVNPANLTWPSR